MSSKKRVSEMTDEEIRELAGVAIARPDAVAAERERLWVAIRHSIPLDKRWRGEALDLLWPIFSGTDTASCDIRPDLGDCQP